MSFDCHISGSFNSVPGAIVSKLSLLAGEPVLMQFSEYVSGVPGGLLDLAHQDLGLQHALGLGAHAHAMLLGICLENLKLSFKYWKSFWLK